MSIVHNSSELQDGKSPRVLLVAEAGLKKSQLILLHCVSAYPTPLEAANLLAIRTLENRFGLPVDFSDHTEDFKAVRPLLEKNGVSAREFRKVIGKFAAKNLPKNHMLLQEDWK